MKLSAAAAVSECGNWIRRYFDKIRVRNLVFRLSGVAACHEMGDRGGQRIGDNTGFGHDMDTTELSMMLVIERERDLLMGIF